MHLNIQTNAPTRISIFDIHGRTLLSNDLELQSPSLDKEFDIHELAPGLYIMRLEMGAENCSKTFVKY
jgi:hypothetical protein